MKRILMLVNVVVLLAFGSSLKALTLEEAVRIGLQNSKTLRTAELLVTQAAARSKEVDTALGPSLQIQGGYSRLSAVETLVVPVPGAPAPITIFPNLQNRFSLQLSLQQPVFTGFRLQNRARQARLSTEASQLDLREIRTALVLQIKTAYWGLYLTREGQKLATENVARLEAHLKDVENLIQAGLATRNDQLKIQVQLARARLDRLAAGHEAQLALQALNNLLGQSLDSPVELTSPLPEAFQPVGATANLVETALASRPDLQALEFRIQADRARLAAVRGGRLPQLFLRANFSLSRPNLRVLPLRDEFRATWDIGLQSQFQLWNGRQTAHQATQAEAQLQRLEVALAQRREAVILEVEHNRLLCQQAWERIQMTQTLVDQAEENRRVTDQQFQNGLARGADLVDAEVALVEAQTNYTRALVDYQLAQARLARTLGLEGHFDD